MLVLLSFVECQLFVSVSLLSCQFVECQFVSVS